MTFDDFPGLFAREREAEKAAELLTKAAQAVTALAPNERWRDHAERLRGAASYAQTAASELLATAGYLEAASAAADIGILSGFWGDHDVSLDTDPHATEGTEEREP